jgi:nickel transport protein
MMKYKTLLSLTLILLLALTGTAAAHKVIVFAWVENSMIYTQSSFGSNRKAKNCQITLVDEQGVVFHTGMTDENGEHALKIPENINSDLIVYLDAGSGHKGHWRLAYDELIAEAAPENLADAMEKKELLEQGPSMVKIFGGLGVIFFLAFALKWFKRKKSAND